MKHTDLHTSWREIISQVNSNIKDVDTLNELAFVCGAIGKEAQIDYVPDLDEENGGLFKAQVFSMRQERQKRLDCEILGYERSENGS